jgi:hypothetical protein
MISLVYIYIRIYIGVKRVSLETRKMATNTKYKGLGIKPTNLSYSHDLSISLHS